MSDDTPNAVEELQRAAKRLEAAADSGPSSVGYDPAIKHAFDLMRAGAADQARHELAVLADAGSVPATHILSRLDKYGPDYFFSGDRMQRALADMRDGEIVESFEEMVRLADGGYAPAAHFLAWLHRYRAVEMLRHSSERFRQAIEHGYAPSERHLARVQEALQIVDFVTGPGGPRDGTETSPG